MRSCFVIALLAVHGWTAPAKADWQNTAWGMTRDEVRASVTGAHLAKNSQGETDLIAPYETAGIQFKASFGFEEDGLTSVILEPVTSNSGDCNSLLGTLRSVYGPEQSESKGKFFSIWQWMDWDSSNRIAFTRAGSALTSYSCNIQYHHIPSKGASGGL